MKTEDTDSEARGRSDSSPVDSAVKTLAVYLEAKRTGIIGEIRAYPSPIPACDEQFNYLLEQRRKLSRELDRLNRLDKGVVSAESGMKRLREFIESSDCIYSDMKHQMLKDCGDRDSNECELTIT